MSKMIIEKELVKLESISNSLPLYDTSKLDIVIQIKSIKKIIHNVEDSKLDEIFRLKELAAMLDRIIEFNKKIDEKYEKEKHEEKISQEVSTLARELYEEMCCSLYKKEDFIDVSYANALEGIIEFEASHANQKNTNRKKLKNTL